MESCGEGNHWEQVSTSQRSERTAYGLLSTSQSTLWEVRERLLHRLVLRLPKATLDILRAYGEDPFRAIFGLELDCGENAGSRWPHPWEERMLFGRLVSGGKC